MRYSKLDLRERGWALLVALTVVGAAATLVATTRGPDAGGYTGTDATTYSFVDISGAGGGASVLSGADDATIVVTLPFAFRYYGQQYTLLCVSTNGALYFVNNNAACEDVLDFANVDLSAVAPTNDPAALLPFWSDLTFESPGAGSVYYQTVGSQGSRRMIVQWNNAFPQGSLASVTFQVILFESNNSVLFQYKTVSLGQGSAANNGAQASVGIRNSGGLNTKQQIAWSYAAPVLSDSMALLFTVKVAGDVTGDGVVNCADVAAVRAAFGRRRGQIGYNAAADLNNDGIVNVLDLGLVTQRLAAGTRC